MSIKTISKVFGIAIMVIGVASCEQPIAQNLSLAGESRTCQIEGSFTSIEAGDYQIKLFNPNNLSAPDIWEGPICIVNSAKQKACTTEISLIKSASISENKKLLFVSQFSGSNETTIQISLQDCEYSIK